MTRRRDAKTAHKIAVLLRKLREKKYPGHGGKSSMARDFGVAPQVWIGWENGKAVPDDVNQRKLAKFFGVSLAVLRGDHSPEPPPEAPEPPPPIDPVAEALAAWKARVTDQAEAIEAWSGRALLSEKALEIERNRVTRMEATIDELRADIKSRITKESNLLSEIAILRENLAKTKEALAAREAKPAKAV